MPTADRKINGVNHSTCELLFAKWYEEVRNFFLPTTENQQFTAGQRYSARTLQFEPIDSHQRHKRLSRRTSMLRKSVAPGVKAQRLHTSRVLEINSNSSSIIGFCVDANADRAPAPVDDDWVASFTEATYINRKQTHPEFSC